MNTIIQKIEKNIDLGINSVLHINSKNRKKVLKTLNSNGFNTSQADSMSLAKLLAFATNRNNKVVILYTGSQELKPVKKKFDVFKY